MADAPWSNGSITALFIEGYPDQLSYAPGETCSLHVSTSSPSFSIKVAPTLLSPRITTAAQLVGLARRWSGSA